MSIFFRDEEPQDVLVDAPIRRERRTFNFNILSEIIFDITTSVILLELKELPEDFKLVMLLLLLEFRE